MELRTDKLEPLLGRLDAMLVSAAPGLSSTARAAVERWRADAAALRFHLRRDSASGSRHRGAEPPVLLAIVGGTGTGKSTLVNRLLGRDVSAASFRRTFTSGPVAVAADPAAVPADWLGVERVVAAEAELPARGRAGALVVVAAAPDNGQAGRFPVLVDTPDLDGDQPAHHAQADRAFRWADAVLFLVTPEKYQMTELLPYYRLAGRYGVPAVYVMNKCEEQAVLEDYQRLLQTGALTPSPLVGEGSGEGGASGVERRSYAASTATPTPHPNPLPQGERGPEGALRVFAIPRDDSAYQPPSEASLEALRSALATLPKADGAARLRGLRNRGADLLGRFSDQILTPLREDRREADKLIMALRSMETPGVGVDVNPLTQQLQRRMQQRSILYLMGPQRILDRMRQAPGLLMRLPRVAWDYVKTGEISAGSLNPGGDGRERQVPDFKAVLVDQFSVLQSRIDDALRSSRAGEKWLGPAEAEIDPGYAAARIDPAEAGKIAEEELADLRDWLEKRWNATPRDTRALQTLLRYLPGGQRIAKWSEAAPYLLTVVLALIHFHLSGLDLMVLGGYGLATWITEKISNEVTARTRATNARITQRFTRLGHEQIEKIVAWLDRQAPSHRALDQFERTSQEAAEMVG